MKLINDLTRALGFRTETYIHAFHDPFYAEVRRGHTGYISPRYVVAYLKSRSYRFGRKWKFTSEQLGSASDIVGDFDGELKQLTEVVHTRLPSADSEWKNFLKSLEEKSELHWELTTRAFTT